MKEHKTGLLQNILYMLGIVSVRNKAPKAIPNIGHGNLPLVSTLNGCGFNLYGGSYRDAPLYSHSLMPSTRLEQSIGRNEGLHIDFPIEDFSVPTLADLVRNLSVISEQAARYGHMYIGCMGGFGRTGTVIASMVMVHEGLSAKKAIEHTRQHIHPYCVETQGQRKLLEQLERVLADHPFEELLAELNLLGDDWLNTY